MDTKKAIIIGAGPAGLTAAYQLLKETDIHPVIYEASEFTGGISRTATYNGNRIDIGGHRFFTKNQQVFNIWKELMPVQGAPAKDDAQLHTSKPFEAGGPDPEKSDRVMLIRNRVSRIFYLRHFFDYPVSLKPETFRNMGLARTMKVGCGYIASVMHKREERSLEDFYINRFGKPLYEMFFEDYTEKLWGVHPSHIAPDWGAQRAKELSLSKAVIEFLAKTFNKNHKTKQTSLIEQFYYPKKGPGQLWETMADEIRRMGGEIHYGEEVVGIDCGPDSIRQITVRDHDGRAQTVAGDYFISSMPIKDLVVAMGPQAPEPVRYVAENLPYRDFITVGLLLKKLKIQNRTQIATVGNIVPDCWIYIQERDVRIGRLQIFNNWSPYMPEDNQHTVWIGLEYFCSEGDRMWNASSEEFIRYAIDELVKIDIIDREDVLDSTHIRVKKAYPAYFGTYSRFGTVKDYLDRFSNLFCVGRNGQHRYNNMDHSMLTAIEAVNAIKTGSSDKTAVWNVNTEKEYQEEKTEA